MSQAILTPRVNTVAKGLVWGLRNYLVERSANASIGFQMSLSLAQYFVDTSMQVILLYSSLYIYVGFFLLSRTPFSKVSTCPLEGSVAEREHPHE